MVAGGPAYLHALIVSVLVAVVAVGGGLACIVTLWHALAGGLQSAWKGHAKHRVVVGGRLPISSHGPT